MFMITIYTTNDLYNIYCVFLLLYDNISYYDSFKIIIYNSSYPPTPIVKLATCNLHNIFMYDFVACLKKYNILYDSNILTNLTVLVKSNEKVTYVDKYISTIGDDAQVLDYYRQKARHDGFSVEHLTRYLYSFAKLAPEQMAQVNFFNNLENTCNILIKLNYVVTIYIFVIYFLYKIL